MGDPECLQFLARTQVNMGPDSNHYIATKVFHGSVGLDDTDALAALIAHRQFRDDYVGLGSWRHDSLDKHGPYDLARISAHSFRPIQKARAIQLVRAYTARFRLSDDEGAALEDAVLAPVLSATSIYRLRRLGQAAQHDLAYILDGFHELVALDERTGKATLIILCGD